MDEWDEAIRQLEVNKSPDTGGFTTEWYKTFKEHFNTFNWVLHHRGEIPPSWRESAFTLSPTEGKDKLDCSNYRPVSLLNPD